MVIAGIGSGLGNQLFQYAMGRRLAARHGVPLKLDLAWFRAADAPPGLEMFSRSYRLHEFNIVAEIATPEEVARFATRPLRRTDPRRLRGPWRRFRRRYFPALSWGMRIGELSQNFEPGLLRLSDNVYLDGWWQSEAYFRDFAAPLRTELTLRDATIKENSVAYVNAHRNSHRPVIAVQVRRGDVARAHEVLKDLTYMPYELVSKEYLQAAMSEFGDDATFLVFSETADDFAWCRANLRARDIHFAEAGYGDLHDFAAMSHCDHNIISNSSFGWWAAWLNPRPEKTVVAPRRWFRPQYAPRQDIHSLVPREWMIK